MTKDQGRVLLSSFVVGPSSFVVGTSSLDKVSPGSDQLYSWGGAEGAPRGYPGPSAPPQWWGFGADSPPQTPTQKCKVRKNLVSSWKSTAISCGRAGNQSGIKL